MKSCPGLGELCLQDEKLTLLLGWLLSLSWDDPISHPGMRVNFNPPQASQKQKKMAKD